MKYVLFNRLADSNGAEAAAEKLKNQLGVCTVTEVGNIDYDGFLSSLTGEDEVYIVGGDGTLNRFANDTYGKTYLPEIYYYPAGSGNDFLNDNKSALVGGVIDVAPYLKELPTVYVNDIERKFLNGIGYGLDGVCCEIGDDIRARSNKKKVNYTSIALKLCLYAYKPRTARITVDGQKHEFKNVWIAPVMKGRFYGGGMMVAPKQNRFSEDKTVTLVVVSARSRLSLLFNFPKIFKGTHEKLKIVRFFTGKEITVEYDEPCALQIDGDTVKNVKSFTVKV